MSILGFIIAIFVLVLVHEFGHFLAAKLNGIKVEEFAIGFPPKLFSFKKGETLYAINLLPIGGYVKVYGEEYSDEISKEKERAFVYKKPWQKISVLIAGVIGNFLLGWLLLTAILVYGAPFPSKHVYIQEVQKASPAEKAGIKPGDYITYIKTQDKKYEIKTTEEFIKVINENKGKEIELGILRKGKTLKIKTTPRKNPPQNQGALGVVISQFEVKKYPLHKAFYMGLIEAKNITIEIIKGVVGFIINALTKKVETEQITGPIGIAKITSTAFATNLIFFLQILALLSLNLAVVNILPFPALDGGRVVMVLYEWITGKRINKRVEYWINLIGFAILILLVIMISIQDINRFFLGKL